MLVAAKLVKSIDIIYTVEDAGALLGNVAHDKRRQMYNTITSPTKRRTYTHAAQSQQHSFRFNLRQTNIVWEYAYESECGSDGKAYNYHVESRLETLQAGGKIT